ncbi:unnamed protein product [Rhodiola kirilowii]
MARGLIKFSVLAVGVCYLLSWVASPTKVFANSWWPVINSKINTVYFGFQGLPILMYMAPIYAVASSVRYHIWLGHIAMVLFTAHGAFYVLYWGLSGDLMQILKWDKHGISNLAGEISLVAGILMWVTTFPRLDKTYRYLRLLQSQQNVKLISARVLPCESVELNFAKSPGLKYPPTSCMFVKVPCVSRLQWHPFTVCSNSDLEEDIISVLIKSEGSWTRKLNQMLSAHPSIEHLQVSVEGPYGPESSDFFRHNTLVMVSGGSGIAPFISIIRGLIHAASNARNTPKAILISAFKSSSELEMLDLLLPLSARSPSALSNLDIQIEAYVTREHEHSKSSKAISTICFKPHHSDAPISATLGPNSWLWLAMIISSSFAFSLLLIGFATRYFIYPVDKNTDTTYPRSIKTIIYMLSFCFSIVVTASVAFLWNKKHCAKEVDGVNDINMVPSVDIELETLPGKSLAHVTNVHYGVKPDLAKILSECGGSSVGVYVCGPKGYRATW